jgi:predicted Rossmann fold flavoprotein
MSKTVIIIGAGAAGMFAALSAKAACPELDVRVLEAAPKPLGKVKISGGGRCNVTTSCTDVPQLIAHYPRGERFLKKLFYRFGPQHTVAWFEERGVPLKTEPDGRIFPVSDESQSIIDALLLEARHLGVALYTRCPVTGLHQTEEGFSVETASGQVLQAQAVVLATGGNPRTGAWLTALGHTVLPPVPSLFTFKLKDPRLEGLSGISVPMVRARLRVGAHKPIEQNGPLLITHWGLSGPVILRLSAWGARELHETGYQGTLAVDFFPNLTQAELLAQLQALTRSKKQVGNQPLAPIPSRLWERLLMATGLAPETPGEQVPLKRLNALAEGLKNAQFNVQGKGEFKEEFVTAGGLSLSELSPETLESRTVPGLYAVGEVLDVDGLTGGFNLQHAWTSGYLAGSAIAQTWCL